tara:strand:- start:89 stop:277 length:189 start_codon:yes stop_codon:yes gene_type:complete
MEMMSLLVVGRPRGSVIEPVEMLVRIKTRPKEKISRATVILKHGRVSPAGRTETPRRGCART